ncbi:MAG: hypothetical protein QM528_00555 [Phycisphaerales bacterium]|nr:hypothetical protein [Phycisphaerales bacterium]
MIIIEHIAGIPLDLDEGRCKTRRTKCPSKMVKENISRDGACIVSTSGLIFSFFCINTKERKMTL